MFFLSPGFGMEQPVLFFASVSVSFWNWKRNWGFFFLFPGFGLAVCFIYFRFLFYFRFPFR
jgi:hypothetical protein